MTAHFSLSSHWIFISLAIVLIPSCYTAPSNNLINADDNNIRIASSDTLLVNIFNWAKTTSNGYVGDDSDPVGP